MLRKYIYAAFLLAFAGTASAQNTTPYPAGTPVSYIRTWDPSAPMQADNDVLIRPLKDVRQATQYIDGIGRPLQAVVRQGSLATGGTAADLVSPVVYDGLGREQYKFLPFAANSTGGNASVSDGKFKANPFQQQAVYAAAQYPGESNFYSKANYEPSPLSRVAESYAPGSSWAGSESNADPLQRRNVQLKYLLNTLADAVRIWTVADVAGSFGTYSSVSAYPAGTLYKTVTTDESKKQVIEFKDKEGQLILKKVQLTAADDAGAGSDHAGWLCTYYMYDNLNRLRCVIQPQAVQGIAGSWVLTQAMLDEQCFRYEYDQRSRMIRKKVPGAGEVRMVYDARGRLVMTQDANTRALKKWLYTTYDNLNRPIATGLITDLVNYDNQAYHLNAAYGSTAYPLLSSYTVEELSNTFYDNYNWLATYGNPLPGAYTTAYDNYFQPTSNTTYPYPQANVQAAGISSMQTGTRVKMVGGSGYLYTVIFYDAKGRAIQSQATNITGGKDISTTQYAWDGHPLVNVQKQEVYAGNPQTHIVVTKNAYDDLGRLSTVSKAVSSIMSGVAVSKPEQLIVQNEYDALGQLKAKTLAPSYNSNAGLEKEKLEYNIRGWLLGMNRDYARDAASSNYFGFDLGYDKVSNNLIGNLAYAAPQYNGNIAGTVWKSKGDGEKRRYDFTYDAVNRLTGADFNQYTAGGFNKSANVDFSVSSLSYDANGNILTMAQKGLKVNSSMLIDNLAYNYISGSNKLLNVIDGVNDASTRLGDFRASSYYQQVVPVKSATTADYVYDANGNLRRDFNKDIGGTAASDGIVYNYMNLPSSVVVMKDAVNRKGLIFYIYDAAGNKLQKLTREYIRDANGTMLRSVTTTTNYISGFVYESRATAPANTPNDDYTNVLQFIPQEEGRIRFKPAAGTDPTGFAYDYMLRDHLGNIRAVITDEQKIDKYPVATLEADKLATEKNYYDIQDANIVDISAATGIPDYTNDNGIGNNPSDPPFESAGSKYLYQLNSKSGAKAGLGITLKVMAGDRIDVFGKSYYFQNTAGTGSNSPLPVQDILTAFLSAPAAAATTAAHGAVTAAQITPALNTGSIYNMINSQTAQSNAAPNSPRAFINVIFFDEQFKAVDFKASMVGGAGTVKDHYSELQNIVAGKSGYVYIYCSNESPVNVFFDNLQVVQTRSPLLEETHYYPFGLTMSGISSKAAGGIQNKEKTFQGQRFDDDLGLNWDQFKWRNHDPQIGRFIEIDPLSDKYVYNSTYAFSENKVTAHVELEGLEAWAVNPTTVNGNPGLSATVTNVNAPFSVTQGGATTGFFPNAEMNQHLGGAIVTQGSLKIPVNANGDYKMYDATTSGGAGASGYTYNTDNLAQTPTMITNVITNGTPVVLNGNRNASALPSGVAATTLTTGPINSATAPNVNLTYSDQAGLPNTFNVRDNSSGTNLTPTPIGGRGVITTTANNFVSGGTMSVTTSEQRGQRGDGYNYTLTVTPTVSTLTVVPAPAAAAATWRIQDTSKSLNNNSSSY